MKGIKILQWTNLIKVSNTLQWVNLIERVKCSAVGQLNAFVLFLIFWNDYVIYEFSDNYCIILLMNYIYFIEFMNSNGYFFLTVWRWKSRILQLCLLLVALLMSVSCCFHSFCPLLLFDFLWIGHLHWKRRGSWWLSFK